MYFQVEVDAFWKWYGQKGVLAFPVLDYRAFFKLLSLSFKELDQPPLSTFDDIPYNLGSLIRIYGESALVSKEDPIEYV